MNLTRSNLAVTLFSVLLAISAHAASEGQIGKTPLKVFILAGQSNMQGHGHIRTLDYLGKDPQNGALLAKVKAADGSWIERKNVWIYYNRGEGQLKKGNLTVGYGASDNEIGPELMFGNIIGEHFDNQILLIKTAWGGRSLAINFRPPSAGPPPLDKYPEKQRKNMEEKINSKSLVVGQSYNEMISEVRKVLSNLKKEFPAYDDKGFELAGFVWFQGWNDMIDAGFTAEYAANLDHLIKDVRKDLEAPNLPVIVAEMGVDGKDAGASIQTFRNAEAAGVANPDFKGNVVLVPTAQYWDEAAAKLVKEGWKNNKWISDEKKEEFNKMGSQPPYHYLGSAKIYSLIGMGLAQAAIELSHK